ncbi:MAG TPA: hypothetical protein DEF35_20810 [Paenibacillus sp.]|uniref:SPRY domain-containing protein n=1 Tax=Paenibacillus TaxID=44249 RepID=UPI000BA162F2|nr:MULTISPECIES: SPRY domain-containing protein [Paenibacillus]OZQ73110.1 hypothetical protein CA599_04520 [Paenibacillus taichungensis]HBU84059.1 hypothetical protein [Paenibacillus sp.]
MEVIDVTLNPNDMGSGNTLSNGNLTVTGATTTGIRATHGKISGKWYWEVKLDAGDTRFLIGVSNKSLSLSSFNTSYLNTSWRGFNFSNGNRLPENTSYGVPSIVGNIIGIALDLDNGTLELYRNGVSMGISHTNIKELGEVYPTAGRTASFSTTATFNFGQTPFMYEIPKKFYSYDGRQYGGSNKFLLSSGGEIYSVPSVKVATDNVIPIMTSNTAPNGEASASSQWSASTYYPYLAFNQTNTSSADCWATAANVTNAWIQYKFQTPKVIAQYKITNRNNGTIYDNTPKTWSFMGSNDGISWVLLDERINISAWTSVETREFNFKNHVSYSYYRLHITAVHSGVYVAIGKLEMFDLKSGDTLYKLPTSNEVEFLRNGSDSILVNNYLYFEKSVKHSNDATGSGKTFEHTIDLAKRRVDKITLG